MVAYSFKEQFIEPIEQGLKRQTVRGPRRRHALIGERLQLFYAMRTKHCRKIIADPVCVNVRKVTFDLVPATMKAPMRTACLIIDGMPLNEPASDMFAINDGFDGFPSMVRFWLENHGHIYFTGSVIYWRYEGPHVAIR